MTPERFYRVVGMVMFAIGWSIGLLAGLWLAHLITGQPWFW